MSSSAPKNQTTTTTSEPWAAQKPNLEYGFQRARSIYDSTDPTYYQGATIASPSATTQTAQLATIQRALMGNSAENAGQNQVQSTVQGDYLYGQPGTGSLLTAGRTAGQLAGGRTAEQQGLLSFAGSAAGNAGTDALSRTASGEYLGSNPYLDATFDKGARKLRDSYQMTVAPERDLSAVAAGRYGSGTYNRIKDQNEQELRDSLGDLATGIYGTAYEAERGRQDAAAGNLGSLLQNENAQRLAALGQSLQSRGVGMQGQSSVGSELNKAFADERSNQMDATRTALGYGQQDYTDLQALSSVGAEQDALQQAQINADIDRHNFEQNKQWNELANYMGMIQGNYGGTSTATAPGQKKSPLMGGLGGAAAGASIGSFFGPFGTAIGGGLGLLGGLFG